VRRLEKWLPWLMVIAGPAILFGPMLARGQVLFWGTPMLQFVPWHLDAIAILKQGHLPLWNPWVGMGAPLLANYQAAVLYPPNWLFLLIDPAWGHGLLDMLHLMVAGAGMIVLMRRLGAGSLGQGIAAVAYALSGYLVGRAGFLSINAATAWLPWIIVASDRLGVGASNWRSWRSAVSSVGPLALALAMQWLAGHAQTAWYSLVFAAAWIVFRGSTTGRWRGIALGLMGLIAACLCAFALDAAQLLPTLEYLMQSFRSSGLDPAFAMTYSFWPWRLLGLLTPDLFGTPVRGDFWGYGNYWEDAIYIGILPLLLAAAVGIAGIRGRSSHSGLIRFLLGAAVIALMLALGNNTPVFPLLFRWAPTFSLFQAPTRWNIILVFALATLGGLGVAHWTPASGRKLYWTRLGTAGAAAIGAAAWLGYRLMPDIQPTFVRALAVAGLWMALGGVLALTLRDPARPVWTAMVGLVVLIDLASAGYGLNPAAAADLYRGQAIPTGAAVAGGRLYISPDLEERAKYRRAFLFNTFYALTDWRQVRQAGLPNALRLDGLTSANNFDPLLPGRYAVWMQNLTLIGPVAKARLLRLMDVSAIGQEDPNGALGVGYAPLAGALRAWVVGQAITVSGPVEALKAVSADSFDPSSTVVLEEPASGILGQPAPVGLARVVDNHDPNEVIVEADSAGPAWLVLSDLFYPGWRVSVDGQEAHILRADYLFRCVELTPGRHQVVFRYEPASFRVGAGVTLTALIATLLLAYLWRRG
jgi:hypothetical protein